MTHQRRGGLFIKRSGVLLILATAVSLVGCSLLRFQVPAKLAKASIHYIVDGQMGFNVDKDLKFGPYRLHDIEVGATSMQRESTPSGDISECRRTSSFRFVAKPSNLWITTCEAITQQTKSGKALVAGGHTDSLTCDFNPKEGKRWTLSLKTSDQGILAGMARGDEVDLEIQFQGALRTGVLIRSKGLDVAAGSLSRPGSIWLSKTLFGDEAHAAAASIATLMLYSETLSTGTECGSRP
jgi:hypothetical protein